MNGLLVLNKPSGGTSRDVVDGVEHWFPGVRAGHAGTLDPLATGVLVVCLGAATRLIEFVQRMTKTYRASIRLGATSDTDDADGAIQSMEDAAIPGEEAVRSCLRGFEGDVEQTPPAHSAAKVDGRRAYALARRGRAVPLAPRRVRIHGIRLVGYAFPQLDLVVDCGKGTYIRSLARDLGRQLGCGGYVETLTRTRIGPFVLEGALDVDAGSERAIDHLLPIRAAVADLPAVVLTDPLLRRLCCGRTIPCPPDLVASLPDDPTEVAILADNQLAAIARWTPLKATFTPEKVFL